MRFEVSNYEALRRKIKETDNAVEQALKNIAPSFAEQAQGVIKNVLIQAAAQAGQDAFPIAYIEPMLEAADKIIIVRPREILIDLEDLGTYEDLQEGFHYGAKIDGGGQVDLPYGGEPLKNDTEQRYAAWQRVFRGETWHGIDYSGSWNETIAARLEAWGDKAPQWLLLQYGQTEWEPVIQPYPILEEINFDLTQIFNSMLQLEISLAAAKFNA